MAKNRIRPHMSIKEAIDSLSGDSDAGMTVCHELMWYGAKIDPDALSPVRQLLALDMFGIYEERIYLLWRDVCGGDLGKMIAVLRACQLGDLVSVSVSPEALDHAIDNFGAGLNVDEIVKAVKGALPNFQPEAAPPAHF